MTNRSAWMAGLLGLLAVGVWLSAADEPKKESNVNRLYELRTYTTLPGRLDALHKRFSDHTMKLFEKHGMRNEIYFVPTDPEKSKNTLIYIVSHDNEEAAKKSWAGFRADPEWIKVRDASEADGKIVEKVESVYMTQVPYSPKAK